MLNKLVAVYHILCGHGVIHRADIRLTEEGQIDIWPYKNGGSLHMTEANLGRG